MCSFKRSDKCIITIGDFEFEEDRLKKYCNYSPC